MRTIIKKTIISEEKNALFHLFFSQVLWIWDSEARFVTGTIYTREINFLLQSNVPLFKIHHLVL